MLRNAALACLDKDTAHKHPFFFYIKLLIIILLLTLLFIYVRSVTEEEVFNGILNNKKARDQAIFYDRKYNNLDLNDRAARLFRDMVHSGIKKTKRKQRKEE